jgi:hypothetical protein
LSAGQQWGLQGFELLTRRFPFNPPDFVDLESRRPRYAPGASMTSVPQLNPHLPQIHDFVPPLCLLSCSFCFP